MRLLQGLNRSYQLNRKGIMGSKIQISDVLKKRLKLIGYLIAYGLSAYVYKTYISDNDAMSLIFGGAVNFILAALEKEIEGEGFIKALKK